MNVELSRDDLMLLDMLLSKAEGTTRVEIHHLLMTVTTKAFLKERERLIGDLLARIKKAMAAV